MLAGKLEVIMEDNMNNLKKVKKIFEDTEYKNYITVHSGFINYMGSLKGGIFLSQLLYWSDKGESEDGYIYKTYQEWKIETGLSQHLIKESTNMLKYKGLLKVKNKKPKNSGSQVVHYQLNTQALIEDIKQFLIENDISNIENQKSENEKFNNVTLENQKSENGKVINLVSSITKSTSKNTSENTTLQTQSQIPKRIIEYLNRKLSTNYNTKSTIHAGLIKKILSEGYVEEDFYSVIDTKYQEWSGDTKTKNWLQPSTLFKLEKFDEYLNQSKIKTNCEVGVVPKWLENGSEETELTKKETLELDRQKSEVQEMLKNF